MGLLGWHQFNPKSLTWTGQRGERERDRSDMCDMSSKTLLLLALKMEEGGGHGPSNV